MGLKEDITNLRGTLGADAVALISRDGLLIESDIGISMFAETFAIMCATVLGAAVTANSELKKSPPERVVIASHDSKLIVTGAGKRGLLVAVVKPTDSESHVLGEMRKVAEVAAGYL